MARSPEFSEIVTNVLADNTAQSVLNHLKLLELSRAHVRTRWVWELLQNARDTSPGPDGELVAKITQKENEIIFQHNGGSFTLEEIAHLIYHGSTKIENEETIGQYGSGFLTTHLLSPEISISGQIQDGKHFTFQLKREVGSVNELSKSMQRAASDFDKSLSPEPTTDGFTTEFRYPLVDDAYEVVDAGIEALRKYAPFVVAFDETFSAIHIKTIDKSTNFKVEKRTLLEGSDFELITVSETENGDRKVREYLLAHGNEASISIPMESVADGCRCLPIGDTPRLFLGFPLIGTEGFSFPAVINSFKFTPTENRDGVYLGQSNDQANNETAINEASDLLITLLGFVASRDWKDTYLLAEIPPIQQQNWLNPDWLQRHLRESLILKIRQVPIILAKNGAITAEDAVIPFTDRNAGSEDVETLWDLLDGMMHFQNKLPPRSESAGWCSSVKSWADILESEVADFKYVVDGSKLASYVEDATWTDGEEDKLEVLLRKDVFAIDWLNQFLKFLKNSGSDDVIRDHSIILTQDGLLDSLSTLHCDQDIPERLKDIAKSLDWDIRKELRDTRLTVLTDETAAGGYDTDHVAKELVSKLQDRAEDSLDDSFEDVSTSLFSWIIEQKKWALLRNFPVFSEYSDSTNRRVIKLASDAEEDVRPLAPVSAWVEGLQEFSELFPKRYTLADAFSSAVHNPLHWKTLEEKGFLRRNVVIATDGHARRFLPDEPLNEDEDHKTSQQVSITNVAFMARDDIGIMARVRQSHRLAIVFWRFLTEWLIPNDPDGLKIKKVLCGCDGCHRYYPAQWLVPLVENKWVPRGERRADKATAQSLADLFRSDERGFNFLNEKPAAIELLEAIGVSRFDLMRAFAAGDDSARTSLDNAFMELLVAADGNVSRLSQASQYLKNLKIDPELHDVVLQRFNQVQQVRENQRLGDHIEGLVKRSLEGKGFVVQHTGIGSDFEIEHDDVTRLELTRSKRTWLVEVKATRGQGVRMTATQARTARTEGNRFLLCVVPVSGETSDLELDTIQDNMKFVADMGPRVASLCDNLEHFGKLRDVITADESQGVQLEVEAGAARVRVTDSVWRGDDSFPLAELANRLE